MQKVCLARFQVAILFWSVISRERGSRKSQVRFRIPPIYCKDSRFQAKPVPDFKIPYLDVQINSWLHKINTLAGFQINRL